MLSFSSALFSMFIFPFRILLQITIKIAAIIVSTKAIQKIIGVLIRLTIELAATLITPETPISEAAINETGNATSLFLNIADAGLNKTINRVIQIIKPNKNIKDIEYS